MNPVAFLAGSQRSTSSHRSDSKGTKDHHSDSKGTKDSSRQGRGRDSSRSSKSDQKSDRTVNTQVTVTVEGGEYDPANPTAEEEDGDEVEEISLKVRPNKRYLCLGSKSYQKYDRTVNTQVTVTVLVRGV